MTPRTLRRIYFEAYSVGSLRFRDSCDKELPRGASWCRVGKGRDTHLVAAELGDGEQLVVVVDFGGCWKECLTFRTMLMCSRSLTPF